MKDKGKAVAPAQAMRQLRPDVEEVLKKVVPGFSIKYKPDQRECGGSDLVDSRNASRLIYTDHLRVVGDPEDTRSPDNLIEEAIKEFDVAQWEVESRGKGAKGGARIALAKPGVPGKAFLSARSIKLKSGKNVPSVGIAVFTACLDNPDWGK